MKKTKHSAASTHRLMELRGQATNLLFFTLPGTQETEALKTSSRARHLIARSRIVSRRKAA